MANSAAETGHDDWLSTSWGNLVELKYGKALKDYRDSDGEYPVYGTNGPVGWCYEPLCDYASVIVGRKGAYRGIHYSSIPFHVIDTAFYVRPKTDINLKWAYYALLLQDINGMDSGSAIPSTSRDDFYALIAKVPPRRVQDQIVQQLDVLNEKIELNRQMNETLEAMAQALFKSWFVDFDPVIDNALAVGNEIPEPLQARAATRQALGDQRKPLSADIQTLFPARFAFTEDMGWVPNDWERDFVINLAQVTDYVANGSFAALKENVSLYDEPEYALYIRTTDFKNGFSREKAKYVDKSSYDFLRKSVLNESDVIISNVGDTGTVFRPPSWLGLPMTLGSNAIALKSKSMGRFLEYYFQSALGQHQIDGIVGGSAQPKFNKTDFRAIQVFFGSMKIVEAFGKLLNPIVCKQAHNLSNLNTLIALRDHLLPKLLSGELLIPDAEKMVAEAV